MRRRFDQYERPDFRAASAAIGLWSVVIVSILFAVYCLFLNNKYILVTPAFVILCGASSYILYMRHKNYISTYQSRRDEAAIKVFNAARLSNDENFAVFLRPFYTLNVILSEQMVPVSSWTGGSMTINFVKLVYPLENTIVEAFSRTMPVVALGKPGETFGVGRILVDETEWRAAATDLIDRAAVVIFQPSFATGLCLGNGAHHPPRLPQQNSVYRTSVPRKMEGACGGLGCAEKEYAFRRHNVSGVQIQRFSVFDRRKRAVR